MQKPKKILVILGPTASGKSALAVKLAKKFGGEIISADSRQVYRRMDIGSGKITKKEMAGIPHHLLDIVSPKKPFSVAQYQQLAQKKIAEIIARKKFPIICGGTGFYIQALVDNLVLPDVPPNFKLRKELKKLGAEKLYKKLLRLDPRRAKEIDRQNPHRLIRAIEIAVALGKIPEIKKQPNPYQFVQIGISLPPGILRKRIHRRLISRMKSGMVAEIQHLRKNGVSWKRLESFGLEYKYLALYLQNKLTKKEMLEKLEREIVNYAKRQMTWFKRDKRITWVKNYQEASDFWQKNS